MLGPSYNPVPQQSGKSQSKELTPEEMRGGMLAMNMLSLPSRVVGIFQETAINQVCKLHPSIPNTINKVGEFVDNAIPESLKKKWWETRETIKTDFQNKYNISPEETEYFLDSCCDNFLTLLTLGSGILLKAGGSSLRKVSQRVHLAKTETLKFDNLKIAKKGKCGSFDEIVTYDSKGVKVGECKYAVYYGENQKLTIYVDWLFNIRNRIKLNLAENTLKTFQMIAAECGARKLTIEFIAAEPKLYTRCKALYPELFGKTASGTRNAKMFDIPFNQATIPYSPLVSRNEFLTISSIAMNFGDQFTARLHNDHKVYIRNKLPFTLPGFNLFPGLGAEERKPAEFIPGLSFFTRPEKLSDLPNFIHTQLPDFQTFLPKNTTTTTSQAVETREVNHSNLFSSKASHLPVFHTALPKNPTSLETRNIEPISTNPIGLPALSSSEVNPLDSLLSAIDLFKEGQKDVSSEDLEKTVEAVEQFDKQAEQVNKEIEKKEAASPFWANTIKVASEIVKGAANVYANYLQDKHVNKELKLMAESYQEEHQNMTMCIDRLTIGHSNGPRSHYHSPAEYFTNIHQVASDYKKDVKELAKRLKKLEDEQKKLGRKRIAIGELDKETSDLYRKIIKKKQKLKAGIGIFSTIVKTAGAIVSCVPGLQPVGMGIAAGGEVVGQLSDAIMGGQISKKAAKMQQLAKMNLATDQMLTQLQSGMIQQGQAAHAEILEMRKKLRDEGHEFLIPKEHREMLRKAGRQITKEHNKLEKLGSKQKNKITSESKELRNERKELDKLRGKHGGKNKRKRLDKEAEIKNREARLKLLKEGLDTIKDLTEKNEKEKEENKIALEKARYTSSARQIEHDILNGQNPPKNETDEQRNHREKVEAVIIQYHRNLSVWDQSMSNWDTMTKDLLNSSGEAAKAIANMFGANPNKVDHYVNMAQQSGNHIWEIAKLCWKTKDVIIPGFEAFFRDHAKDAWLLFAAGQLSGTAQAAFIGLIVYYLAIPVMKGIVHLSGGLKALKNLKNGPQEDPLEKSIKEMTELLIDIKYSNTNIQERVIKIYCTLNLIGEQILKEIEEYSKLVVKELNIAKYDKTLGKIKTKLTENSNTTTKLITELPGLEGDPTRITKIKEFLSFIEIEGFNSANNELYFGFNTGGSVSQDTPKAYPVVSVELVYRNPEYFTPLLANGPALLTSASTFNMKMPNLALFEKTVGDFIQYIRAFQRLSQTKNIHTKGILQGTQDIKQNVLRICQRIQEDAKEINHFYPVLEQVVGQLVRVRNRIFIETNDRINTMRTIKNYLQNEYLKNALIAYSKKPQPSVNGSYVVGSAKFYLHTLLTQGAFLENNVSNLNLEQMYVEHIYGYRTLENVVTTAQQVWIWSLATVSTAGTYPIYHYIETSRKVESGELTQFDWSFENESQLKANEWKQYQEKINFIKKLPLDILFKLQSRASFVFNQHRMYLIKITFTNQVKKQERHEALTFSLSERKFVKQDLKSNKPSDLFIDVDTGLNPKTANYSINPTVSIKFQASSPIQPEDLRSIPEASDSMYTPENYDLAITKLKAEYHLMLDAFINGKEPPAASRCLYDHFKKESCQIITGIRDDLVPLIFPKELIEECEKLIPELYGLEATGSGTLIPFYDFSLEHGTLIICFKHVSPEDSNSYKFCRVDVAKFDMQTLRCFQTDIKNPKSIALNEFLIQAMYTGYAEGLGLPGDETFETKTRLLAPSERKFPGLYNLWVDAAYCMIEYNSRRYSKEVQQNLCEAIENDDVEMTTETEKMFRPLAVQIDEDYLSVLLGYKHKKTVISSLEKELNEAFSLYLALVKLLSKVDNQTLWKMTENYFQISTRVFKEEVIKPSLKVSEDYSLSDVPKELVELFINELKMLPSEKLTNLRKHVQEIKDIEKYINGQDADIPAPIPTQQPVNRPYGLPNIGNSCFMNASLQVLLNSAFVKNITAAPVTNKIAENLRDLQVFIAKNHHHGTSETLALLRANLSTEHPDFAESLLQQKDAGAFIATLMKSLGYKNPCEETRSGFSISNQLVETVKEAIYDILYIPITGRSTQLTDLLNLYFNETAGVTEGIWKPVVNQVTLEVPQSTIRRRLQSAPEVFICQLQRFKADPSKQKQYLRIHTLIDLPADGIIDLSNYMKVKSAQPVKYRLKGCVDHHGDGIDGGHYTAFIQVNGQWFYANDNLLVSPVSFETVKAAEHYIYLFEKVN
jgi:ubiquitin C-terminal hydrolase